MRDPYGNRIGRNDLCWCGSGRKYKRCHLGRESAPQLTRQEVLREWRKIVETEECSHPDAPVGCGGAIIRAHTIQRSGGLSRIAEMNHVLQVRQDLTDLMKSKGDLKPVRVGYKEASTFRGFCNTHDTATFSPLETHPLVFSDEQCFLLGYRAMCFAVYAKKHIHVKANELLRKSDAGRDFSHQVLIQGYASPMAGAIDLAMKDLNVQRDQFDLLLKSGSFASTGHCVIELDCCPEVLCSSLVTIDRDFDDQALQDFTVMNPLDCVAVSVVPTDTAGAIVFSWVIDNSGAVKKLIDSLLALKVADLPHAALRFVFSYMDNVCISPTWWNGLAADTRRAFENRMRENLVDLDGAGQSASLKDDGVRAVQWNVVKRTVKWPGAIVVTV